MVMGFVDQSALGVVVAERTVAADPTMTRVMEITTRRCGKYRLIVDKDCKVDDGSPDDLRLCADVSSFCLLSALALLCFPPCRQDEFSLARACDCSSWSSSLVRIASIQPLW